MPVVIDTPPPYKQELDAKGVEQLRGYVPISFQKAYEIGLEDVSFGLLDPPYLCTPNSAWKCNSPEKLTENSSNLTPDRSQSVAIIDIATLYANAPIKWLGFLGGNVDFIHSKINEHDFLQIKFKGYENRAPDFELLLPIEIAHNDSATSIQIGVEGECPKLIYPQNMELSGLASPGDEKKCKPDKIELIAKYEMENKNYLYTMHLEVPRGKWITTPVNMRVECKVKNCGWFGKEISNSTTMVMLPITNKKGIEENGSVPPRRISELTDNSSESLSSPKQFVALSGQ